MKGQLMFVTEREINLYDTGEFESNTNVIGTLKRAEPVIVVGRAVNPEKGIGLCDLSRLSPIWESVGFNETGVSHK